MKGSKGHSHNSSGKQKAMPVSQAEPLFPRVHVNETRNGPKAPPRNKMALYEQLTVPSHHYLQSSSLQSSGSAWSAMNPAYAPQYSPYAGNFAPWVVFSAADGVPTLASQKSAVMDSGTERELQTVPRVAVPDENFIRLSERTAAAAAPSSNVSSKDFSNKRARHEDFAVPTYCFPKGGSGKAEPLIASRTLDGGHGEPPGPTIEAGAVCQQSGEGYTQTGQAPGFFYPQKEHTRQTSRGTPGTMGQVTERICSSGSTGNVDNHNDDDFSETLHQEQIGDDASIVEPDVNIAARDVIGAVGEQEFWKIRKNLLRQQHIFTVQIFELHRLIKVQQLLAQSPSLLLEPDTDNVALPEPSQPGRIHAEESSDDCREIQAQALKRPSDTGDQKLKAINDGDMKQRNDNGGKSSHAAVRHETPSLLKCSSAAPGVPGVQYAVPNAYVGSTNSWAYAPYPMNQWTMLPTSGAYPYMFQPSAPAPVGYNAAYQPVFGGPGGYEMFPMVSATAPGQRQADMSVYYQHALPPGHHWQPPVFCNSAIPSVPSPWYAFPQYYDAATMSSASGHGPDVSIHQQQQQHQHQQQYQHQQLYQQQQQQHQHQQQQQHQHQQQYQQQQQHQQHQQHQHQHQHQQHLQQHQHLHQQRQQHQEQQRDNEGESAFQRIPKLHKEVPSSYSELSSERTGIVQQVQERDFPQGLHNTDRIEDGGDNNVRCAPTYSLPFSFSSPDERHVVGNQEHGKQVAPRPVMATLESAAGILKSIQRR